MCVVVAFPLLLHAFLFSHFSPFSLGNSDHWEDLSEDQVPLLQNQRHTTSPPSEFRQSFPPAASRRPAAFGPSTSSVVPTTADTVVRSAAIFPAVPRGPAVSGSSTHSETVHAPSGDDKTTTAFNLATHMSSATRRFSPVMLHGGVAGSTQQITSSAMPPNRRNNCLMSGYDNSDCPAGQTSEIEWPTKFVCPPCGGEHRLGVSKKWSDLEKHSENCPKKVLPVDFHTQQFSSSSFRNPQRFDAQRSASQRRRSPPPADQAATAEDDNRAASSTIFRRAFFGWWELAFIVAIVSAVGSTIACFENTEDIEQRILKLGLSCIATSSCVMVFIFVNFTERIYLQWLLLKQYSSICVEYIVIFVCMIIGVSIVSSSLTPLQGPGISRVDCTAVFCIALLVLLLPSLVRSDVAADLRQRSASGCVNSNIHGTFATRSANESSPAWKVKQSVPDQKISHQHVIGTYITCAPSYPGKGCRISNNIDLPTNKNDESVWNIGSRTSEQDTPSMRLPADTNVHFQQDTIDGSITVWQHALYNDVDRSSCHDDDFDTRSGTCGSLVRGVPSMSSRLTENHSANATCDVNQPIASALVDDRIGKPAIPSCPQPQDIDLQQSAARSTSRYSDLTHPTQVNPPVQYDNPSRLKEQQPYLLLPEPRPSSSVVPGTGLSARELMRCPPRTLKRSQTCQSGLEQEISRTCQGSRRHDGASSVSSHSETRQTCQYSVTRSTRRRQINSLKGCRGLGAVSSASMSLNIQTTDVHLKYGKTEEI